MYVQVRMCMCVHKCVSVGMKVHVCFCVQVRACVCMGESSVLVCACVYMGGHMCALVCMGVH